MPNTFSTTEGRVSAALIRWPNGPTVMICSDLSGGMTGGGTSMSGPPWIVSAQGSSSAKDGRRLEWRLESHDGGGVECRINGKEYDLEKGKLFLVTGASMTVEQLQRDLSTVEPQAESCKSFVRHDPDVSKLLGKAKP